MCITPGVLLNSVGVSTSTKPGKEYQSQETFHYQSLNNTCTSTGKIYDYSTLTITMQKLSHLHDHHRTETEVKLQLFTSKV